MKLVYISEEYTDFLRAVDERIPHNRESDYRRPYVGVVLQVKEHLYFVPLTTSHKFKKIWEGKLAKDFPWFDKATCDFKNSELAAIQYKGILFEKEYFQSLIYGEKFPKWLNDYIKTSAMQRLAGIAQACGSDYTKLYNYSWIHTVLSHSIGTALIVWNFMRGKDERLRKCATLAGLFHDIATPVFKHCIDFLKGDPETQEATEELTEQLIQNDSAIVKLLARDKIDIKEVCDYAIYPIADSKSPRVCADRIDYTLVNIVNEVKIWTIDDIKEVYSDMTVLTNEDGKPEVGFKTSATAEKYILAARQLWPLWFDNRDRIKQQFIADTLKMMIDKKLLHEDDFYKFSDQQIIKKILNCKDKKISESFKKFQAATQIFEGDKPAEGKYCVSVGSKKRWTDPLFL